MDLSKSYSPCFFSLNTNKHGLVEFSNLTGWRMTLIFENTKNIQEIEPSEFSLIVSKYLISKIDNIIYDEEYYKKIKTHKDINLILDKEEHNNFAKKLVSLYKTVIIDYTDVDGKDNHLIIKMFFLKTNEEYEKAVERITKFTKLPFDNKLFDKVNEISETAKVAFSKFSSEEIKRITQAAKAFSGISPEQLTKISENAQNALKGFPFDKLSEINRTQEIIQKATTIETPHVSIPPVVPRFVEIEVLHDIRDTFNSFITIFNSFMEYCKNMLEFSNSNISKIRDSQEIQIKQNEKTSKIALYFSIAAIIISLAIGIVQIKVSGNSNKHIDKLNTTIEQLNKTIIEHNLSNKKSSEVIEVINNVQIPQDEDENQIENTGQHTP